LQAVVRPLFRLLMWFATEATRMMLGAVDEVVQKKDGRCPDGLCAATPCRSVARPLFSAPKWFATQAT
jgi:hypothetical protein